MSQRLGEPRGIFHIVVRVPVRDGRHLARAWPPSAAACLSFPPALRVRDDDHGLEAHRVGNERKAIPVFPAVPSTMAPPGRNAPRRIASSTIKSAARSFTDWPGLRNSALPRISPPGFIRRAPQPDERSIADGGQNRGHNAGGVGGKNHRAATAVSFVSSKMDRFARRGNISCRAKAHLSNIGPGDGLSA